MLYKKLIDYINTDIYPMHMPGHKRNGVFMPQSLHYNIDITEIPGFDDLREPRGVLLETDELAANLYKSREAFLLVNGSTVGILAAIGACVKRGDKILAVDNCHWSTPNAAELFGFEIIYINANIDEKSGVACSISPCAVESALKLHPDIKMVAVTSPSYEGVVSDIETIASVVHDAGALLFIDGAHGAHLGFSDYFPPNPGTLGADIVVVSLHKTLPALTQCSLLHVFSDRIDSSKIKHMLNILQTSSPSYILMASIDHCLRLLSTDKDKLFNEYVSNLEYFDSRITGLQNIHVLCHGNNKKHPGFYSFDPGKIIISLSPVAKNMKKTGGSGSLIADILRKECKIEVERVCDDYIIAMTSICDTHDGFKQLAYALCDIDNKILKSDVLSIQRQS